MPQPKRGDPRNDTKFSPPDFVLVRGLLFVSADCREEVCGEASIFVGFLVVECDTDNEDDTCGGRQNKEDHGHSGIAEDSK